MVLMRQGSPEERHNAVPHDLVHGPLIAVHRGHHALEHRVEEVAGLFGIAVSQQLHRAFEVGKQHRHLLALAFEGGLGGASDGGVAAVVVPVRRVPQWSQKAAPGLGR